MAKITESVVKQDIEEFKTFHEKLHKAFKEKEIETQKKYGVENYEVDEDFSFTIMQKVKVYASWGSEIIETDVADDDSGNAQKFINEHCDEVQSFYDTVEKFWQDKGYAYDADGEYGTADAIKDKYKIYFQVWNIEDIEYEDIV